MKIYVIYRGSSTNTLPSAAAQIYFQNTVYSKNETTVNTDLSVNKRKQFQVQSPLYYMPLY